MRTVLLPLFIAYRHSHALLVSGATRPLSARARTRSDVTMGFLQDFLRELDNFVDDATMRRLGNGSKFYGRRKSTFYGVDDPERKRDPQQADAEEDYRGPAGGSYFVLSKERDELGRPLSFLSRKEARAQRQAEEDERWEDTYKKQALLDDLENRIRKDD